MCDKSAATPGVLTTSYNESSLTKGLLFINSDKGCPIPPEAPATTVIPNVNLVSLPLCLATGMEGMGWETAHCPAPHTNNLPTLTIVTVVSCFDIFLVWFVRRGSQEINFLGDECVLRRRRKKRKKKKGWRRSWACPTSGFGVWSNTDTRKAKLNDPKAAHPC